MKNDHELSHPHAERVEQLKRQVLERMSGFKSEHSSVIDRSYVNDLIAAVRAEGAPALEAQRQTEDEKDLGAALLPADPSAAVTTETLPLREGVVVECAVCGYMKKPIGRSAPMGAIYCDDDCAGYHQPPYVGSLWPRETSEQFGYPVGPAGTRIIGSGTQPLSEASTDTAQERSVKDNTLKLAPEAHQATVHAEATRAATERTMKDKTDSAALRVQDAGSIAETETVANREKA